MIRKPLVLVSVWLTLAPSACVSRDWDSEDPPKRWVLGAEPLVSIGELEGDSAYLFSRVAAVRLLSDGRIAVADQSSATVRIFNADGRFVRRMGRRGQGPGEFDYIAGMFTTPHDTIVVFDSNQSRLTTYLSAGELVSTVTFRMTEGYPEVYLGRGTDGSSVVAWVRQVPRNPEILTAEPMRLGRFGHDGLPGPEVGTSWGMRRIGSPIPMSAHFLGTLVGDTAFHTDGMSGEVQATDFDGMLVRTFRVEIDALDPVVALERLREALDSADLVRLEQIEGAPGLDSVPLVSDMLADDQGLLWLKRYDPASDSHWLGRGRNGGEWIVVTTDGRRIAEVAIPESFRPLEVRGDLIAGVARDELDVERILVYQLRRGAPE